MKHLELSIRSKEQIKKIVDEAMIELGAEMDIAQLTNLKISIDITSDKSMPRYEVKITYSKYQSGQICYDKKE